MRGAWIEIPLLEDKWSLGKSRPMRGAWIEIKLEQINPELYEVAPHAGRVD